MTKEINSDISGGSVSKNDMTNDDKFSYTIQGSSLVLHADGAVASAGDVNGDGFDPSKILMSNTLYLSGTIDSSGNLVDGVVCPPFDDGSGFVCEVPTATADCPPVRLLKPEGMADAPGTFMCVPSNGCSTENDCTWVADQMLLDETTSLPLKNETSLAGTLGFTATQGFIRGIGSAMRAAGYNEDTAYGISLAGCAALSFLKHYNSAAETPEENGFGPLGEAVMHTGFDIAFLVGLDFLSQTAAEASATIAASVPAGWARSKSAISFFGKHVASGIAYMAPVVRGDVVGVAQTVVVGASGVAGQAVGRYAGSQMFAPISQEQQPQEVQRQTSAPGFGRS